MYYNWQGGYLLLRESVLSFFAYLAHAKEVSYLLVTLYITCIYIVLFLCFVYHIHCGNFNVYVVALPIIRVIKQTAYATDYEQKTILERKTH